MKTYRLREELRGREITKRLTRIGLLYLGSLAVFAWAITQRADMRQAESADRALAALKFYAFMLLPAYLVHSWQIRRKVIRHYATYGLDVDELHLVRHQPDAPDLTIALSEVNALEEKPGNGIRLRTATPAKNLWLAAELESFSELRLHILSQTGLIPKNVAKFWRNPFLFSIVAIACLALAILNPNFGVKLLCSAVAESILLPMMVIVQRSPDYDEKAKRATRLSTIWTSTLLLINLLIGYFNRP